MVTETYEENWRKYRRLRNVLAVGFLAYIPVLFLVAYVLARAFHTFVPGFVLALSWMASLMVASIRLNIWRCPRCRKPFSLPRWWYNKGLLARKCVHCGLPKFTLDDDAG